MRVMEAVRLCLVHVHAPIVEALRAQGHMVLALRPPEGQILHLPGELERHGFTPDIVVQQELLAPRTLLAGLEGIAAVRVFWALDPHLNAFWQAPYARLFDLVFSTQARTMPELAAQGAGPVLHLPWFAPEVPFTPHAQRQRLAGFVGRLGPERPVRQWLVELLAGLLPGDFEAVADLSFPQMLEFTRQCRAVPNESIAGEVNFRLFEAAGHGCLVLAQDLGPEQAALLEPGREMLVCADALELAETLRMLRARPRLAEIMGRAAWERCHAEHLPGHRARRMVAQALAAPRREYGAGEARAWLSLALAGLLEAGRMAGGGEALVRELARLSQAAPEPFLAPVLAPVLTTALVRAAHAQGDGAALCEALAHAEALEASGRADQPLRLACSMLHLRRALAEPAGAEPEAAELAQAWLWGERAGLKRGPDGSPKGLLLGWAEQARSQGLPGRGGFGFDPQRHLPASELECLCLVRWLDAEDVEALQTLSGALRGIWGGEALLLGALSDLTLRRRNDWRAGLALGLCNLRCYRLRQGLDELALAARLAAEQGQELDFERGLALADPSGRTARALAEG